MRTPDLLRRLEPQEVITEDELERGLRTLRYDGVASQLMGTLAGGVFLTAFALSLGASPMVIGLLAALAPLSQVAQVPAVPLIEWLGRRKLLVVLGAGASRLFLLALALLPWLAPPESRIPLLLAGLGIYYLLGTIAGLGFSAWLRDLVPEDRLGRYMGSRAAIATAVGAAASLIAGTGVDAARAAGGEQAALAVLIALGAAAGLLGVRFLAAAPEPLAPRSSGHWAGRLLQPAADPAYRRLLLFLGAWSAAVNLAAPFFTVYMLQRLSLPMSWVAGLTVVSQLCNVAFFTAWGRLADRYSNRAVLAAAGPLFMLSYLLWPLTTAAEQQALNLALLTAIHLLAGVSTAGVTLCAGNIALKLAPAGESTAYLATNALVCGAAATLAALAGGALATLLAGESLAISLRWNSALLGVGGETGVFEVAGLDFLFLAAGLLGLATLTLLRRVPEPGEHAPREVLSEIRAVARRGLHHVSGVAGLRDLLYFPYPFGHTRRGKRTP